MTVSGGGDCFHYYLARGDDHFTHERTERPFCTQQSYANIVLSAKGQRARFVCDNVMQILYFLRKDGASVSVCNNLMQDHNVCERT